MFRMKDLYKSISRYLT